jgi:hypothetical protein
VVIQVLDVQVIQARQEVMDSLDFRACQVHLDLMGSMVNRDIQATVDGQAYLVGQVRTQELQVIQASQDIQD